MEHAVLDGVDLADFNTVLVEERPLAAMEMTLERLPGVDGYAVSGGERVPRPIVLRLVALGDDAARREFERRVAPMLLFDEPRRLQLSSDDGLYRMVVPSGQVDFAEYVSGGAMSIGFQPLSAAMYGEERSVTVPSGGSVAFTVGGTAPTRPVIRATQAVRDASEKVWGLRLDGRDFIHVATGSSSARAVVMDCDAGAGSVAGETAIPTLESDWLVLERGEHVLAMDYGTGEATVSWVERWY